MKWSALRKKIDKGYETYNLTEEELSRDTKAIEECSLTEHYESIEVLDSFGVGSKDQKTKLYTIKVVYIFSELADLGPKHYSETQLLGLSQLDSTWNRLVIMPRTMKHWVQLFFLHQSGWIKNNALFSFLYYVESVNKQDIDKLKTYKIIKEIKKLKKCYIELNDNHLFLKRPKQLQAEDSYEYIDLMLKAKILGM